MASLLPKVCSGTEKKIMGVLSYRGAWVQSHCVACLMLIQLASDYAVQPCSVEETGCSVSQLNSRSCQLLNLYFQLYNFYLYLIYMRAFIVTYYAKWLLIDINEICELIHTFCVHRITIQFFIA